MAATQPTTTAPATRPTRRAVTTRLTTRPAGKPNILLICTDDQSAGLAGFEGGKTVKTPNLDRLAEQSIYFSRCYVPTPQCAPTRASIITGQYPHAHGVIHDGVALKKSTDTITARLKKSGYTCGFVGQWQLHQNQEEAPAFGLTHFATNDAPASAEAWMNVDVRIDSESGESGKFLTEWQAEQAIYFIEDFQDRPFFLWLSLNAPHEPFTYPPGTEAQYPPAAVDFPNIQPPNLSAWPAKLQQISPFQRYRQFNDQMLREARSRYYATITHLDEQVGRVLKQLDDLKLSDETWVIFTSDSGFAFGQHTLFGKGPAFFESMVRVPLLVRPPHEQPAGRKCERMVSLVDLAPTVLEMTGLEVPIGLHGRSMSPLLKDSDRPKWTDEVFFEYHKQTAPEAPAEMEAKMRGVIAMHFKFIDYLDDADMFFDLKRDPDELLNAVNAPQYMGVAKVLRERLNQWRRETRDPVPIQ